MYSTKMFKIELLNIIMNKFTILKLYTYIIVSEKIKTFIVYLLPIKGIRYSLFLVIDNEQSLYIFRHN